MYNQLLAILFETKKKGMRSMQVIFYLGGLRWGTLSN